MERLFYGSYVAKTFGHVRIFLKWRGQISKSRGQNLAIGHDILGIVIWSFHIDECLFGKMLLEMLEFHGLRVVNIKIFIY